MISSALLIDKSRLQQALSSWREWPLELAAEPRVIDMLTQGGTNATYVIQSRAEKFCLRLNALNSDKLGIDRDRERRILTALEPLHIAPKWLYYDPRQNFNIFNYIAGKPWSRQDYCRLRQRERLMAQLKKVQSIELENCDIDYAAYIKRYIQILAQRDQLPEGRQRLLLNRFRMRLDEFMQSGWQPVLCHHDLIPQNILETENGIKILDWEYAACGHPAFDQTYIYHCIKYECEYALQSLRGGAMLDQVIYWLITLWQRLQK